MAKIDWLAAGILSLTLSAVAGSFTLKDQASDWSSAASYAEGTGVPEAGDTIYIPENARVTLSSTDTASVAVFNTVDAVLFAAKEAYVTFDVPSGSLTLSKPLHAKDVNSSGIPYAYGYVCKTGAGTLCFDAPGTGADDYDYFIYTTEIREGSLYLQQNLVKSTDKPTSSPHCTYGHMVISNSAALYLPKGLDRWKDKHVTIASLTGEGAVNAVSTQTELRIDDGYGRGPYAGAFGTEVFLFIPSYLELTGNSTMKYEPWVYGGYHAWGASGGVIAFPRMGCKGEASPLGTSQTIASNVRGGTYRYLGTGETTDKLLRCYPATDGYTVFDAGATGGLVFSTSGGFTQINPNSTLMNVLGLTGSNTLPCLVQGYCTSGTNTAGVASSLQIIKRGTGTWRLADCAAPVTYRTFKGGVSVREGTFQFDSVSRVGEYCAMGPGGLYMEPDHVTWENATKVDWAFALGDAAAKTEGAIEYTGTRAGDASARPFILKGDGRLRADHGVSRYTSVAPTVSGAKTLTLCGTSTLTNTLASLPDTAANPVSLVKEGAGTWKITGDLSFHGSLAVKGGKLIVEQPGDRFGWYRFTIKDLFDPVVAGRKPDSICMNFLGLYDEDGWVQNLNLTCPVYTNACELAPGQAGWETVKPLKIAGPDQNTGLTRYLTDLFTNANGYGFYCDPYLPGTKGLDLPDPDVPRSWLPIVMRLPKDATRVTSFDWVYYFSLNQTPAGLQRTPSRFSLEGSLDGVHWENLNLEPADGDYDWSLTTNNVATKDYCFVFSKQVMTPNASTESAKAVSARRHAGGKTIKSVPSATFSVLNNVSDVSVAGGGELVADGAITLANLAIDGSAGGGTVRGFAFAAAGTLDLTNLAWNCQSQLTLPVTCADATDLANLANWTITSNGRVRTDYRLATTAAGKLTILRKGLMIYVR